MSNAKWFWLAAASLALASCGGGGRGADPAPAPGTGGTGTGAPVPAPAPAPAPQVVGPGAASDCFNPQLYGKNVALMQTFSETQAGRPAEQVVLQSTYWLPLEEFNGLKAPSLEDLYIRGNVTTLVKRYFLLEGLDLVAVGSASGKVTGQGLLQDVTTVTYAPLPRDKSFTLQPGQNYVTSYTGSTKAPGAAEATPFTYAVTTYYLGQETLTVQGKTYNTCKFQYEDSRGTSSETTWYVKSEVGAGAGALNAWGVVARSEGRKDGVAFTRETVKASIGTLF